MLELTIKFRNLQPMDYTVETGSPIISELLLALQANINGSPDVMFNLAVDDGEEQVIYFPRSEIMAIESKPAIDISQILIPDVKIPENRIYPAKMLIQEDFLPLDDSEKLFQYILKREHKFSASSVTTENKDFRRSRVLFDISTLKEGFESRLRQLLPDAISQFELSLSLDTDMEIQITASGRGDYFKAHNDNGAPETSHRQLSFVYYLFDEPKPFSGGELRVFDYRIENNYYVGAKTFRSFKPINNSIILFPSFLIHEVKSVENDGAFRSSRFSVNGWFSDGTEYQKK